MSAVDERSSSVTAVRHPSEDVPRKARTKRQPSLLGLGWWTVPLHVLLGFGFWWYMQHQPDLLASILLWIHVGFPCLLLLTARWWWNRWGELLALLLMNHAATFGVLICLPWA